jgi:hypothetical protein
VLFVLGVGAEEAAGESGDGAGCRTCTLYAGVSETSGCWMTGAEDVERSFGSSENLTPKGYMRPVEAIKKRKTYFLPSKLRNPMMVFALFFTSCCFASLPMYCVQ